MPDSTPAVPSNMPPFTTLSTWEPIKTAGACGFRPSLLPNRFPIASSSTARPACSIKSATNAYASLSSGVKDNRVIPPASLRPILRRCIKLCHNRSRLMFTRSPPFSCRIRVSRLQPTAFMHDDESLGLHYTFFLSISNP